MEWTGWELFFIYMYTHMYLYPVYIHTYMYVCCPVYITYTPSILNILSQSNGIGGYPKRGPGPSAGLGEGKRLGRGGEMYIVTLMSYLMYNVNSS